MVNNLFFRWPKLSFFISLFGAHGIFRSPNFEISLRHIDLVKVVAKDLRFTRYFFSDTYTVAGFPFKKTLKQLPTVIK